MADEEKKTLNPNRAAYVLSEEQLMKLIAEVRGQQAPHLPERPQGSLSPDQQVNALVDQVKGNDREPHKIEEVPSMSLETKATFLAVVTTSKSFPSGRVLALKDYTYPQGIDSHVTEGGLVPEGMAILLPNGNPDRTYKQWRWENFWKVDLARYVGKDAAWLRTMNRMVEADKAPQAPEALVSTGTAQQAATR